MSRHYDTMAYSIGMAKERIVHALKQYVLANGEDFTDYHRDEFGIEEEEDGAKVLKVLNISDNGGCYFPWTERNQVGYVGLGWYTYAFLCLYVVEEDGVRYLKYYMLWNEGAEYDSDESEPDHDCVESLPLQVIDKLIAFIDRYDRM